ncbi:hypothetical protein Tco_0127544 [Tanacetum coccineum]
MSSDSTSSKEPDSPEAAPALPDYVTGPEELEQAPLSPNYVPGPEYPEYLAPSNEEVPIEDQPYDVADSPIALSLGYVADSHLKEDPEEDSEDGPVDYPAHGGDDNDDDSSEDDEEEEDASEEEEEHLAPIDSIVAPVVDHVPSFEETEPFETDESAATPPSPLISLSPPSAEERLARCFDVPVLLSPTPVPTSSPLPSPSLPPLPASLFIPSPVDRRKDIPEAELPPHKRLCLTTSTSRYEVGESSTAAARPMGGHRANYRFISTLDAETRRQRAEEVGYDIRDVWVDPTEAVQEVAPTTLEGVNDRVIKLVGVLEEDTQDIYAVIKDVSSGDCAIDEAGGLISREAWAYSVGLSSAVHQDLQAYRTHTQIQDHRIASQEALTATLVAQNNMPPRRTLATARAVATARAAAAAAPMIAASIE